MTEYAEWEIEFAEFQLQHDRNRGIALDADRARYYRRRATAFQIMALQLDVDEARAGAPELCAAEMIEAELKEVAA